MLPLEEYYNLYGGINPSILQIEGFEIENGILSVEMQEFDDNYDIYNVYLDGNVCGYYNKVQMKNEGNLRNQPKLQRTKQRKQISK